MPLSLFRHIPLSARPTYRLHLRTALWWGVQMAVIEQASYIALTEYECSRYEVGLMAAGAGIGMILSWFEGRRVVGRSKAMFAFWPRVICGAVLILSGTFGGRLCIVGGVVLARIANFLASPAIAAIWRANYPPTHRGTILGFVAARQALVTAAAAFLFSMILERMTGTPAHRILFAGAGIAAIVSGLYFLPMRVKGDRDEIAAREAEEKRAAGGGEPEHPPVHWPPWPHEDSGGFHGDACEGRAAGAPGPLDVIRRNWAFRRFLLAYFLMGFGNHMATPVLAVFLKEYLRCGYMEAVMLTTVALWGTHVLTVGGWGRYLDRANPLLVRSWATVLTSVDVWMLFAVSLFVPGAGGGMPDAAFRVTPLMFGCVLLGRLMRGAVEGAASLLYSLGVMYFAPRREVPVYYSAHMTLTGIRAIVGPMVGVALMGIPGFGARGVFLSAGILGAVAAWLFHDLGRRYRPPGSNGSFADMETVLDGPDPARAAGETAAEEHGRHPEHD
ncbi:MAG: MFS transporter [Planctomycetota bacterium]|nr:MFS transporter [Planctomycetota bacterium]